MSTKDPRCRRLKKKTFTRWLGLSVVNGNATLDNLSATVCRGGHWFLVDETGYPEETTYLHWSSHSHFLSPPVFSEVFAVRSFFSLCEMFYGSLFVIFFPFPSLSVRFIDGGNRSSRRKPTTCRMSLKKCIT